MIGVRWIADCAAGLSARRRRRIIKNCLTGTSLESAVALHRLVEMGWIEPVTYDEEERVIEVRLRRSYWTSMSEYARAVTKERMVA